MLKRPYRRKQSPREKWRSALVAIVERGANPSFIVSERWGRSQRPLTSSGLLSLLHSYLPVPCKHPPINLRTVAASSIIRRQLTNHGISAALFLDI